LVGSILQPYKFKKNKAQSLKTAWAGMNTGMGWREYRDH